MDWKRSTRLTIIDTATALCTNLNPHPQPSSPSSANLFPVVGPRGLWLGSACVRHSKSDEFVCVEYESLFVLGREPDLGRGCKGEREVNVLSGVWDRLCGIPVTLTAVCLVKSCMATERPLHLSLKEKENSSVSKLTLRHWFCLHYCSFTF